MHEVDKDNHNSLFALGYLQSPCILGTLLLWPGAAESSLQTLFDTSLWIALELTLNSHGCAPQALWANFLVG
jgi:hypothetical protein